MDAGEVEEVSAEVDGRPDREKGPACGCIHVVLHLDRGLRCRGVARGVSAGDGGGIGASVSGPRPLGAQLFVVCILDDPIRRGIAVSEPVDRLIAGDA